MSKEVLRPFNPSEEITAGRYVFDGKLGLGKFDRCYSIPMMSIDGEPFALGTFQDSHVDFINQARLPDDVFVPTVSQMEKWNEAHIGEDWRSKPQKVLDAYGVKLYGEAYHEEIESIDEIVCLASSSYHLYGSRGFLVVARDGADFEWCDRRQCAFVPVFFDGSYLKNT